MERSYATKVLFLVPAIKADDDDGGGRSGSGSELSPGLWKESLTFRHRDREAQIAGTLESKIQSLQGQVEKSGLKSFLN